MISGTEAPTRLAPVSRMMTILVAVPLLGTFFPLESYLSAPTQANPLGTPVPPTVATMLTLVAMYAIIGALYWSRSKTMVTALVQNWFLLAFAVWAIVTAIWAESPSLSFNRSGRLLLGILYAIYLAQACDRKTLFRILFFATAIGIVGSLFVTVLAPSLSKVVDARGAFRGAFQHKNILGSVATLGIIISVYAAAIKAAAPRACLFMALLSLVFLGLSNSVTSFVALFIAASLAFYLRSFGMGQSPNRIVALTFGLLAIVSFLVLITTFPEVLSFTGRDLTTLTGRTDVWHFAQNMIDWKPILGWGHGAWGAPVFEKYVLNELAWPAPNAHNAWLDFRLQLGIPGLALGTICAVIGLKRAISAALTCEDGEYLVWVAVVAYQGVRSGTETLFVDPSSLEMFWFALAVVRLGILARSSRRSAAGVAVRFEDRVPGHAVRSA